MNGKIEKDIRNLELYERELRQIIANDADMYVKKGKVNAAFIVATFIVAIISLVLLYYVVIPGMNYQKAITSYEMKYYEEAFRLLGDVEFKNSDQWRRCLEHNRKIKKIRDNDLESVEGDLENDAYVQPELLSHMWYRLGVEAFNNKDYRNSRYYLKKAVTAYNSDAHNVLDKDKLDEAFYKSSCFRGMEMYEDGNIIEAIELLEETSDKDPNAQNLVETIRQEAPVPN